MPYSPVFVGRIDSHKQMVEYLSFLTTFPISVMLPSFQVSILNWQIKNHLCCLICIVAERVVFRRLPFLFSPSIAILTPPTAIFNTVDSNFNTADSNFNTADSNFNTVDSNFNTVDSNFNTVDSNFNTADRD